MYLPRQRIERNDYAREESGRGSSAASKAARVHPPTRGHPSRGLYIVAWFDQESWTATNDPNRKRAAGRWLRRQDLEAALEVEREKQESLGRQVSFVVLDFSLRRPTH